MIIQLKKRRFKRRGGRSLPGLRAGFWRYRWILWTAMLLTFPLHTFYLFPLARAGLGWIPLLGYSGVLLILIIVGARRQSRPYQPLPPKPGVRFEAAGVDTLSIESPAA